MTVFLILLAVTAAFAAPKHTASIPNGRIIGGHDVTVEDFPYQISFLPFGNHICGGSIITENYVITAAHCTDGDSLENMYIRVNSSIRDTGGTVIKVRTVHQNPSFNYALQNDISILELEEPIQFGVGARPIRLPELGETIPAGSNVTVSGWGFTQSDGPDLPTQLQAVDVNIVGFQECQDIYAGWDWHVSDSMICAGVPEGGKGVCNYDSGGPLVADGTLWGIVSWGNGCAIEGWPQVYGDVSALRRFIREVTGL